MRRVLVTGSRDLEDKRPVQENIRAQAKIAGGYEHLTVVHGHCPKGADHWADDFCSYYPEITVERHPADWDRLGKAAGFLRNLQMVKLGADVCLAFPRGEARGTMHCALAAKDAKIPVVFA